MLVLPAIDIKDGNCVRLYRGDYSTVHKVAESAVETAKEFEKAGAQVCVIDKQDGDHFVGDISEKAVLEQFAKEVIGKYGRIAKAMRTVLSASAVKDGKRYSLDILDN